MIPEMLLLDHLISIVLRATKKCVFCFCLKLLEEKMLELRRQEEKSSSHTDELSQVIKVRKKFPFEFVELAQRTSKGKKSRVENQSGTNGREESLSSHGS